LHTVAGNAEAKQQGNNMIQACDSMLCVWMLHQGLSCAHRRAFSQQTFYCWLLCV